jgi:hypothetical protein
MNLNKGLVNAMTAIIAAKQRRKGVVDKPWLHVGMLGRSSGVARRTELSELSAQKREFGYLFSRWHIV